MSAGEFFDLVRPVFLIISALLSILVLANAQRNGLRALSALIWALATFFLPLVTLPLYLLFRLNYRNKSSQNGRIRSGSDVRVVSERFLLPFFYGLSIFALIALSQYREYNAIDAYLARAKQAKLDGDRQRTIREYKAALALDDDAHTHNLLGIEFNEAGDWGAALSEFRLAEWSGEPDPLLPFRIGALLDKLNQPNQAEVEYKRFLYTGACLRVSPNARCEIARQRLRGLIRP
jgi:tetratricopeptide (TPR) repeat protein